MFNLQVISAILLLLQGIRCGLDVEPAASDLNFDESTRQVAEVLLKPQKFYYQACKIGEVKNKVLVDLVRMTGRL